MRVSCNSDCCILDPEELGWERERKRERERRGPPLDNNNKVTKQHHHPVVVSLEARVDVHKYRAFRQRHTKSSTGMLMGTDSSVSKSYRPFARHPSAGRLAHPDSAHDIKLCL